MQFEDVNEQASITRIESDERLFRFEYSNGFYGSCTFTARVVQHESEPVCFDEQSLQVAQYKLKNGSPVTLLRIAKTFFKRSLNEFHSLEDLEQTKTRSRSIAVRVFSYFLLFLLLALVAGLSLSIFHVYREGPDFYEQWFAPATRVGNWHETGAPLAAVEFHSKERSAFLGS